MRPPKIETMSAPILLVEDNPDDVLLLRRALTAAAVPAPVAVVRDGREARDYLAGDGIFANRVQHPLPVLMLLDLQLPHFSGFAVLEWLRAQPGLKRLPVIVLTSSREDRDVRTAYDLGANSYVVKPSGLVGLQDVARRVREYWLETNVRPPLLH
jgi:CheY-like chemotaxis protein